MSDFLEPMQPVIGRAVQMIARHAFPNGSTIRCVPCGKQRSCTTSEIAEWMQTGFPKCKVCKRTTDLVTPRDERIRTGA